MRVWFIIVIVLFISCFAFSFSLPHLNLSPVSKTVSIITSNVNFTFNNVVGNFMKFIKTQSRKTGTFIQVFQSHSSLFTKNQLEHLNFKLWVQNSLKNANYIAQHSLNLLLKLKMIALRRKLLFLTNKIKNGNAVRNVETFLTVDGYYAFENWKKFTSNPKVNFAVTVITDLLVPNQIQVIIDIANYVINCEDEKGGNFSFLSALNLK